MGNNVSLFINTAFIMGCIAMAIVFMALPLPPNEGLYKYRISLRFLAGGYLTMAILKTMIMAFDLAIVNFISMERLTISSLQATFFVISLVTLLNPRFITRKYLYVQITPVFLLSILYLFVAGKWGNPQIMNLDELIKNSLHPAMLIRELFVLYYFYQLVYLSRLFFNQARIYEKEIANYFSDSFQLQLPWVKYCFYASLTVGILAVLSSFLFTEALVTAFSSVYAIFYLVFGIYYIQYPRTFVYIEPVIYPQGEMTEEVEKSNKRLVWDELKNKIIAEKYYLKAGVNIEDMSRHLKIGRTALSNYINNEEGMNFNTWINYLRVEEAKDLFLKYPNHNLIEISEMVGFSESSNFSRQFKVVTNVSPSLWRQTRLS